MTRLPIDPTLDRQLFRDGPWEEGPWVFWRNQDGERVGFWADLQPCPNPDCQCWDVNVALVRADERLRFLEIDGGLIQQDLEATVPESSREVVFVHANVSLDSGKVDPGGTPEGSEPQAEDPALLRWFEDELDGEMLGRLHTLHRKAKGLGPVEPDLGILRQRDRGEMVPWNEIFPGDRLDVIPSSEGYVEVWDGHCAEPRCSCTSAAFYLSIEGRSIGGLKYDWARDRLQVIEVLGKPRRFLLEVFEAYRRRHPNLAGRLSGHAKRIRELAATNPPIAAPPTLRRTVKVGRNDPCPCGSGRKYKKCCGSHGAG